MLEITITLRINYDTANKKQKEPIMIEAVKQHAKEILTIAELTADRRAPQIAVQVGDNFCTMEEIRLVETS